MLNKIQHENMTVYLFLIDIPLKSIHNRIYIEFS